MSGPGRYRVGWGRSLMESGTPDGQASGHDIRTAPRRSPAPAPGDGAPVLAAGTGVIVYLLLWVLMPAGPPAAPGAAGAPGAAVEKPPAGPRSPVPRLTVAALLIVVGILAMITRFSDWDIGARGILGAALLVVGLGLVAAAFSNGRTARGGLIALGVVLSLALVAVSNVDSRIGSGMGDRTYRT